MVHRIEPRDIIAASELEKRHRQSFWDALAVISAARVHATRLVTEDLPMAARSLADAWLDRIVVNVCAIV